MEILDGQFCPKRLLNDEGFLQNQQTGSGEWRQTWTTAPSVALATFNVTQGQEFGNLIGINASGFWNQLDFPNTPLLFLQTNAAGQLIAAPLPPSTVPDPLSVTTINATNAVFTNLQVTGPTVDFNAIANGTIASVIGLNSLGILVKGTSSTGLQMAMFFEAPTSPAATTPNAPIVAGDFLIIGNQLYDSGGSLVNVTNSQTLTVAVAGKYVIWFGGEVTYSGGRLGPAFLLSVNGVTVNNGNTRPFAGGTIADRSVQISAFEMRDLSVGDVIRIQLANTAGSSCNAYEVRIGFLKIG